MRLEDMSEWVDSWALEEMYAGVPGKGAVDAWHLALATIEPYKLEKKQFAGAVAPQSLSQSS